MSKLNLEIKLKHIREYEKAHGSLTTVLQGGVVGMADFLTSLGKSEEEVEALFKEYGVDELQFAVLGSLQDGGFLSRQVDIKELRSQVEASYADLVKSTKN